MMNELAIIPKNICAELKELFTEWAYKHSQEPEDSTDQTFPCRKASEGNNISPDIPDHASFACSFCPDGYTSLNGNFSCNEAPEIEVLFVLKEANVSKEGILYPEMNGTFWFDKCVEDSVRIRYRNKFEAVLNKLYEDKLVQDRYSGDTPFGYMNINKRGGYGRSDMTRLKNYSEKYECMINRQIFIMKPKVIVCFGCFGLMNKIIIPPMPVCLVDMYHPAYSGFKASYKRKKNII